MQLKFSQAKVKNLPTPLSKPEFHWDSTLPGFGVRITPSGKRSYIVQSRINGRPKRRTLGSTSLLTCEEARRRAMEALLGMRDGIDPLVEKRRKESLGITLREVMEEYIANRRTKNGPLRPKSKQDIELCVNKHFADWADRPVAEITRDKCIRRFRELSVKAPGQANLAFRNLRALLNRARENSVTKEGDYTLLPYNPVTQMLRTEKWNPQRPRNGRLPKDKIGSAWNFLRQSSDIGFNPESTCTSADLISFMLLTGCRVGEASRLTWDCIDLESAVPTFYLKEPKNHNPVTLPVSHLLTKVLESRKKNSRRSRYVFPAVRGKTPYLQHTGKLFKRLNALVGRKLSNHDLRRTFEDMCQYCNVDSDKRRQLLNHISSDVHGQSYANNPDPSELLPAVDHVASWVERQARIAAEQESGANVVSIA